MAGLALFALGPRVAGWWTRQLAIRQLDAGAFRDAQDRLSWSAVFAPNDAEVDLLSAACFRRQDRYEAWSQAMRAAKAKRVYLAGDDDQAVFTWAGADVKSFLSFSGTIGAICSSE